MYKSQNADKNSWQTEALYSTDFFILVSAISKTVDVMDKTY
jgi:hypothetical protein